MTDRDTVTAEPLPTLEQAEDAAARALARLFCQALAEEVVGPGVFPFGADAAPGFEYIVGACRALLRGPLAEDYSRRPGGYCLRSPADPTLRALGRLGARLVELSYTAPARLAVSEADELWTRLRKEVADAAPV